MEIKVLWAFIPGVALIVFTVGLVLINLKKASVQKKADWWSAEMGTITQAQLKKVFGFWGIFPALLHKVVIQYEYRFDGKVHRGTVLNYQGDQGYVSKKKALKVIGKYRKGNTVPVHVHPNHPDQCYLEIDRKKTRVGGILVSGVLISALLISYSLYPEKVRGWFKQGVSWTQDTVKSFTEPTSSSGTAAEDEKEENWVVKTKKKVTAAATDYYSLLPWNEQSEDVGKEKDDSEEKGMLDWT